MFKRPNTAYLGDSCVFKLHLVLRTSTRPSADSDSDHNLLVADLRIQMKAVQRNRHLKKYVVRNIGSEYTVEVRNRFEALSDVHPVELEDQTN